MRAVLALVLLFVCFRADAAVTTMSSVSIPGGVGSVSLVALVSIAVTPTTSVTNATQQYTATGTYSDGSTANLTSAASWASTAPTVATINSGGLLSVVQSGATSVSATYRSVVGSTTSTNKIVFASTAGSGSTCSSASPCSLSSAQTKSRTLTSAVVDLAAGTYVLGATMNLTSLDNGTTYRSVAGAIISGAISAPAFSGSGILTTTVPAATATRQLYVGGVRALRARQSVIPAGFTPTATGFTSTDTSYAGWPDILSAEVWSYGLWMTFRCPITAATVNAGLSVITLANPCWDTFRPSYFGTNSAFENALELVTTAGQFYLNSSGLLSYKPRAGEDTTSVAVPVLEQLVYVTGSNITFQGLSFKHTTWLAPNGTDGYITQQASFTRHGTGSPINYCDEQLTKPKSALTLHGANNVTINACQFSALGGGGVAIEAGSQSNTIDSSTFADISAGAIYLGDVNPEDHHPTTTPIISGNTIRNSTIHDIGIEYWDAAGIFAGYTRNTTIDHNTIYNVPYTGISVGWGWGYCDVGGSAGYATPTVSQNNAITNNLVHDYIQRLADGGAIYVLGAQSGSTISGNYTYNANQYNAFLYLDNGSQGWTVSSNVVFVSDSLTINWLYEQTLVPQTINNIILGNNYTSRPDLVHLNAGNTNNSPISLPTGTTPVLSGWPAPAVAIAQAAGAQ